MALRCVVVLVLIIATLFALSACGQNDSVYKIGVLMGSDLRGEKVEGLIDGLRRYGYIEGQSVQYIIKNAKDKEDVLAELALELAAQKPDVIIAAGEVEAFAAREAIQGNNIPIVFIGVGIPVEIGLVADLNEPGCSITGVDNYYVKLSGKRLEMFKKLLPDLQKVAVIYNLHRTPAEPSIGYIKEVAAELDLELTIFPISSQQEAVEAFRSLDENYYDGVLLLCSLLIVSVTEDMYELSVQKRLPVMGVSETQTKMGLFASYEASLYKMGEQAARMVDKILKGYDACQMPVEAPSYVELSVNVETIKKLGLKVDSKILASAGQLIGVE
ncbi:MAG: ABC transporter substrate-binding protein [Bacillota bacterium]